MSELFKEPPLVTAEGATAYKGYPHPGSYISLERSNPEEIPIEMVAINFQYGHPEEVGRNGVYIDEVIDALADHLSVFQSHGHPMRDRCTALAITKLEEASMWIRERKRQRERRGVLNTDKS